MTRTEFINYIKAMPFYKGLVTSPSLENTNEAGDKFYKINIRFIKGNVIEYRDVYYTVLSEGTAKEEVFFLEREPKLENIAPEATSVA